MYVLCAPLVGIASLAVVCNPFANLDQGARSELFQSGADNGSLTTHRRAKNRPS
jgi:hypothetical protein